MKRESTNAAQRLVSSYKKSLGRIADNPYQFPIADDLDVPGIPPDTYRKCVFEERYKALFIVGEGEVFVDAVIDTRMENLIPSRVQQNEDGVERYSVLSPPASFKTRGFETGSEEKVSCSTSPMTVNYGLEPVTISRR